MVLRQTEQNITLMVADMAVFKSGKFHCIIAQICHLFHWGRDEQQAGQNEHKSKRKTYEQKLDSEYVRVIHDYISKMKTDNLWQTVGGLCANTIPEYIPALSHTKCGLVV